MYKKLLSLALALALCLGMAAPALAVDFSKVGVLTSISCGHDVNNDNVAFIDKNGTLWISGENTRGQLGNGSREHTDTPVKVMEDVAYFSLGDGFVAAIKNDGSLWMWGDNTHGQLGNGRSGDVTEATPYGMVYENIYQTTPVKVMDGVAAVSCGGSHTAIIKTDGSLWMCGMSEDGQLGNGGAGNAVHRWTFHYQTVPIKVMDGVTAVSCGSITTAVIKEDGSLWMWGGNHNGTLGIGTCGAQNKADDYLKTPIKVMDGVASVYCHYSCTAIIKTDGSLWMCGWNLYGQVGNGLEGDYQTPMTDMFRKPLKNDIYQTVPVKVLDDVTAVSFGTCDNSGFDSDGIYTFAVKTDGSLWVWGEVEYLTVNPEGSIQSPLRAAGLFTVVQPVPAKVMDGVAAVAGSYIVKEDGSIVSLDAEKEIGWGGKFSVKLPGNTPAPVIPTVGGFSDVKESDYFAQPVLWAVEKGVTSGTSANTFSPNQTCTTAQILTMIWAANGSPKPSGANPFTDVTESDYFYQAALWAYEKGLVSGSHLYGGDACTRGSTVEYLWKLAGSPDAGESKFADAGGCSRAVAWASSLGITGGTSDTTFSPEQTCTRGQIMTFLYKNFAG